MKCIPTLCLLLLIAQVNASLLDGLEHQHGEHHGEHGEHHGEHGEHHGEHGEHHGDHGEHHGEHGDQHGEHHGDQGEHHGDQGEHHDDQGEHHEDIGLANEDPFADGLSATIGGNFLSSLPTFDEAPADPAPAPAPAPAPESNFDYPTVQDFAPETAPAVSDFESNPFPDYNDPASSSGGDFELGLPSAAAAEEVAFEVGSSSSSDSFSSSAKQLADQDRNSRDNFAGEAGIDYPILTRVPDTSFSCGAQEYGGYYADPEAQCQVFHICMNGRNLGSFLCPNGTLFHQQYFVCDWWYNVNCDVSSQSYGLNSQIGVVPEESQ